MKGPELPPASRSPWLWATVALWLSLAGAYGWVNLRRYAIYDPTLFDAADFAHLCWNTLHGRPFQAMTWEPARALAAFSTIIPIYFALMAVFAALPRIETLILLTPTLLLSGAVPLFLYARLRLRSEPAAFAAALAYLLHPFASLGAMAGLSEMQLFAPAVFWAAWAMEGRRSRLYWAAIALANMTKTYAAAMTLLWGVVRLRGSGARLGARTAALSALWLALSVGGFLLLSKALGVPPQADTIHLGDLGATPAEAAARLLAEPSLLVTRLWSPGTAMGALLAVLPWLGLPLLAPIALLPVAPQAYFAFFTGFPETGYVFGALAFTSLAAVAALERIGREPRRLARWAWALGAGACLAHYFITPPLLGPAPLTRDFSASAYARTPRHALADEILRSLPPEGAVLAEYALAQHLWDREGTRYFDYGVRPRDYEWVLLDLRAMALHDDPEAKFLQGARRADLLGMLESGEYGAVRFEDAFLLLRRGARGGPDRAALAAIRKWTPNRRAERSDAGLF